MRMPTAEDNDAGAVSMPRDADEPSYNINNADYDDSLGRPGLTARAEAAGFSPIRLNKSRQHALEVDPRTKLRIVSIPAERRVSFADLQDVVIHIFADCFKITSADQYAQRVLIITDTTLFLCTKDGSVTRCTMVDRIKTLSVTHDSKSLAIQIPSEFDILLKFQNSSERDRVVKVLRTVYRRLSKSRLPVELVTKGRKLDPKAFNMNKPPHFRLTLVPQRTKEQLRQALEVFEQEEEALIEELDMVQDEMELRHQAKMKDYQATLEADVHKLQEVVKECWANDKKLEKLREEVGKGKRTIEQVDGAFGTDGEMPQSKDAQVAELELVMARLNAAVYASTSEQSRKGREPATGPTETYFQKDLPSGLRAPVWPGATADDVVHGASLEASVRNRLLELEVEMRDLREKLEHGQTVEQKIQQTEERIAYLRHVHKSGKFQSSSSITEIAGGLASSLTPAAAAATGADQRGADIVDPAYSWLADLPQEISVETITADPRTGLHFVEVPDVMRPYFADALGSVLHFFAVVRKPSKMGELVKRILVISDQALYLCTPNGVVKRCVDVVDIDEILLDSSFGIGLRSHTDYDLTFQCTTSEHRREIVEILQRIYKYSSGGRAIPCSDVPRHQRLEAFLRLAQPPGYVMQLTPFRPKQKLIDAIIEKRDIVLHNQPIHSNLTRGAVPQDIHMPEAEYLKLRAVVAKQMEYEWRQDAQLVQLRAQIDNLEGQLKSTTDEVHFLKNQIDTHRCDSGVGMHAGSLPIAPGSGIMPTAGPGTYRQNAEGLFFIKVDPIQINCELDVLKISFAEELLFTGHANGFVNIWELSSPNQLLRTLRDHTAKITDMDATAVDLLTASADSLVRRWDLTNGRCTSVLSGHKGPVNAICRGGSKLVSAGQDKIIQVWDLERGSTTLSLRGHHAPVVDVKFEGDMLVSVEWGWVLFWDMRGGKVVRSLRDEYGGLRCLDYSDGIAIAGGCGGDITVWDVSKGGGETISGHSDDVLCVQVAGKAAITSGSDCKIKMWDLASMKHLGVFNESHPFETRSFFMEGKHFVAGQGQFAKIWTK